VNLFANPIFASTTAANGYAYVNSDAAGPLTSSHISRLTSKAINCSGKNKVYIRFESLIGIFSTPSDHNVLLKVSNNNTTWTTYNFLPGLTSDDQISADPEITILDISSVAANKSNVYLQWEWTGNNEYWWMLDDIVLSSTDLTPANDLAIDDFLYPVSSAVTPVSQIATDTFGFYAFVSNNGLADQHNVTLYAEVRDAAYTLLYSDSATIATLTAGYKDTLIELPGRYAPNIPIGIYSVLYFVKSDGGADGRPADNVQGDYFEVTQSVFAKENGPTGAERPGFATPVDWAVGNLYRMSSTSLDNYKAVGFEFASATDPDYPIEKVHATAYLFKVHNDVAAADFATFNKTSFLSPTSMDRVGKGEYQFAPGAKNYDIESVEIQDFQTGASGVHLTPGASYIAAIGYADSSRVAYHTFDYATKHFFYSSMVYAGQWYLDGFSNKANAVLRMVIDLITTTDDKPLPESTLTVFPNPARDIVNLKVDFNQPTDATVTLAQLNGRVIQIDERKALTSEVLTYEVLQLPAGAYIARIATKTGTATKTFIVQR
jgi:hypothetical protein